jgi:RimJ/RimL family protein N-acetyltransferase
LAEIISDRFPWEGELKTQIRAGDLKAAFLSARSQWLRLQSLHEKNSSTNADDVLRITPSDELSAAIRWTQSLAPLWWEPIQHGSIVLRRSNETDHQFFKKSHEDVEFRLRFARRPWWQGDLKKALSAYAISSPRQSGLMYWTVMHAEQRVGLASISQIDFIHERGEFSIGFPGKPHPGIAHLASLMALYFAFFRVRLHKLYAYVYEDNPAAAEATLRLGFHHEGSLRDHFRFDQGYLSVSVFGLTVDQLLANAALVKTIERRLGLKVKER